MSNWRALLCGLLSWVLVATGVGLTFPAEAAAEGPVSPAVAGGVAGSGVVPALAAARGLSGAGVGDSGVVSGLAAVRGLSAGSSGFAPVVAGSGLFFQLDSVQEEMLDRVKEAAFQGVRRPGFDVWPGFGQVQIVGLDSWFRVDDESWVPLTFEEALGEDDDGFVVEIVTASASGPARVEYKFEDRTVSCDRQGLVWSEGADPVLACTRGWEHTSVVEPQSVQARLVYEFDWVLENRDTGPENEQFGVLGSGSFTTVGNWSDVKDLVVGEVGTVVSDGSSPEPVVRVREDAVASRDGVDKPAGCGWSLLCHVGKAAKGLWDLGVKAWDNLSGGILTAARTLWSVLSGCFKNVTDAFFMLKSMLENAAAFATNPGEFVVEQVATLKTMVEAFQEAPTEMLKEVFGGALELELLQDDPAAWLGFWGCQFAAAIFTGGSSLAGTLLKSVDTFAGLIKKIETVMSNLGKKGKFRNNNKRDSEGREGDRENDPNDDSNLCTIGSTKPSCGCNSFPAGTLVMVSDSVYRPIELVSAGEQVMTFNTGSREWSQQEVLAQWSAVEETAMATINFADGGDVVSTDDHLFWVNNRGEWVEADELQPGDYLLGPDGVTRVDSVDVSDVDVRTVWELDTGADNFVVHSGTTDALVHNSPCSDQAWEKYDGSLTRGEFDARWDELDGLVVEADLPEGVIVKAVDPVTGQPVAIGEDGVREIIDLRPDDLISKRADEIFTENTDLEMVLGLGEDIELGPGEFKLDAEDWTPDLNNSVIDNLIAEGEPIRLATDPLSGGRLNDVPPPVFVEEMQRLTEAGWTLTPTMAFPPG